MTATLAHPTICIRDAEPSDNDALIDVAAACPMEGDITLAMTRAPDFFQLNRLEGAQWRVGVAEVDGRVVGCVMGAERRAYLHGVERTTLYAGDLKLHPAFRGTGVADALSEWVRCALAEMAYMRFAPLDMPAGTARTVDGTLAALMERRFEAYKSEVVAPFYSQHFRNYSRQVVLVDVLGALLGGREVFEDTQRALDAILESFRYGQSGIIRRVLQGAHIEKVLFAATKADHVPEVQRDHLASLLRSMVALPALDIRSSNAAIDVATVASVISTEDDTQDIDGHRVQVVVGKPVGSDTRAKFFVGNVPARSPRPQAWGKPFLNIPVFEPPAIDVTPIDGIPHINLDLALEFVIGDRLR